MLGFSKTGLNYVNLAESDVRGVVCSINNFDGGKAGGDSSFVPCGESYYTYS